MLKNLRTLVYIMTTGVIAVGCESGTSPAPSSTEVTVAHDAPAATEETSEAAVQEAAIAKLGPEDQQAARAQKFCAVMVTSPLGSMGTPIKLEIKGEPVFVCCGGCKAKALKNPDETLATVARLKAENSAAN